MSKNQINEVGCIGLMTVSRTQGEQSVTPAWSTTSTASRTQGEQSVTTRSKYYNKQYGRYGCKTTKETYSSGSFGRGGHKDEHKVTDTYRVGDSKGYTEYYREERFRTVEYGNKNNNYNNHHPITYASDSDSDERFTAVEYGNKSNNYNNSFTYASDYDSD